MIRGERSPAGALGHHFFPGERMNRGILPWAPFLLTWAGLLLPGCQGLSRKCPRPLYESTDSQSPVSFKVLKGKGGVTLSIGVRAPFRFLGRPIATAHEGRILRLTSMPSLYNFGYIPPRAIQAEVQVRVPIDWVIAAADSTRESGVTEVILKVSPAGEIAVLYARTSVDSPQNKTSP